MQFVNHNVFKVYKELLPLGVMGQNARMQHVRIGDDDMPLPANRLACIIGGIAVVGEGFDVSLQFGDQAVGFMHLVLGQRLGGKKIKGPCFRLIENALQDRQIVAQRFAAGRGGHQNDILAVPDKAHGLGLMLIEFLHAPRPQNRKKPGIYPWRIVFPVTRSGRNFHNCRCVGLETFIFL